MAGNITKPEHYDRLLDIMYLRQQLKWTFDAIAKKWSISSPHTREIYYKYNRWGERHKEMSLEEWAITQKAALIQKLACKKIEQEAKDDKRAARLKPRPRYYEWTGRLIREKR